MAGIGDELAHLGFAALARLQRESDVVQHPVERQAHGADFGEVVGGRRRDPLGEFDLAFVERELGDSGCHGGEFVQRRHGAADDHRADQSHGDQTGGGNQHDGQQQCRLGFVQIPGGQADDHQVAVGHGSSQQPEFARAKVEFAVDRVLRRGDREQGVLVPGGQSKRAGLLRLVREVLQVAAQRPVLDHGEHRTRPDPGDLVDGSAEFVGGGDPCRSIGERGVQLRIQSDADGQVADQPDDEADRGQQGQRGQNHFGPQVPVRRPGPSRKLAPPLGCPTGRVAALRRAAGASGSTAG